jgi:signal transduction histidine kinase
VRLTALSAAVAAVVLTVTAALLLARLRTGLVDAVDASATARAADVAGLVQAGRLSALRDLPAHPDVVVQVIGVHGEVLASSTNATGLPRLFTVPPGPGARTARQVSLRNDTVDYRVAAVRAGDAIVYSGSPVDDVSDSVTVLTTQLAVGAPALLALLTAGAWLVIGRALRPVEVLRREAAAIPAMDLSRRLAVPSARELAALAATLNDLLRRAHEAAEQQRRFIADAAHELRNPVAALLSSLEVHERVSGDPEAAGLARQAERLSELVNDLLALARLDSGSAGRPPPVDLGQLVREEAASRPGISVNIVPAVVRADAGLLRRAVANLLDNAVRHARHDVDVCIEIDGPDVVLSVTDDGPGVPDSERERIFDRFTRLDDARSRDAGGVGLGLAIARETVVAAGGSVRVEDARPGARFVVRLPALGARCVGRKDA